MLSGGYLSKLTLLTVAVGSGRVRDRSGLSQIRSLALCEHETLMRLALDIGIIDPREPFQLSEFGRFIEEAYLKTRSSTVPFRKMLTEYIRRVLPPWSFRIPSGRMETVAILPADVVSCFQAAKLLDAEPDEQMVAWWFEMSEFVRGKLGERKVVTGYRGEVLSIQFETRRTGRKPKWVSFESNYAGYDLSSTVSAECQDVRLVEVKSSGRPVEAATFFVSENEWRVAASCRGDYHFHLWLLGEKPILADVPSQSIAPHIPQNHSAGLWKTVEIPFSAFFDKYRIEVVEDRGEGTA